MSMWPWAHGIARQGHDPLDYPYVVRWFDQIRERPAVQRGGQLFRDLQQQSLVATARDELFGDRQFEAR